MAGGCHFATSAFESPGKVYTGFVMIWIGLEVNTHEWCFGLSPRRAAWICNWLDRAISSSKVSISELSQALGRMQFGYGVLVWDMLFLSSLYTLVGFYPMDTTAVIRSFARQYVLAEVSFTFLRKVGATTRGALQG